MKVDLTSLFNNSCDRIPVSCNVDLSDITYSTYNPIKNPVDVTGEVFSKAGVIYLDIDISYDFYGVCDRCAAELTKSFSIKVKRIIVEELQNEENDDDYIIVSDRTLDIDELVNEEVSLSIPNKILCKEDCRGLCPQCGANLNIEKCDCKPLVDPRMAALLELLEDEE